MARLIEAVGIDSVVTIDAHGTATFDNAFRCHKEHLEGAPTFAAHFAPIARAASRIVVLSPDVGGVQRARVFATLLARHTETPVALAFLEKQRSGGQVSGELQGARCRRSRHRARDSGQPTM